MSTENAIRLGIEKVDLDELLSRADFITVHKPLNDSTRNIISADASNKTKKGVRIINCARGGLVDELALAAALDTGNMAGVALDAFVNKPATAHVLFGLIMLLPRHILVPARQRHNKKWRYKLPNRWLII